MSELTKYILLIVLILVAGGIMWGVGDYYYEKNEREVRAAYMKKACEESGGTYNWCPGDPSLNEGLCIPCSCPQGSQWFGTGKCVRTATAVEDDVEGWKTYRNEEYGFTLKYPAEYEVTSSDFARPDIKKAYQIRRKNEVPNFQIYVYDAKGFNTISDWYNDILSDRGYTLEDPNFRTKNFVFVDGIEAIQLRSDILGRTDVLTYLNPA